MALFLEKRYKYFFLGIVFASLTWIISFYLFWSLTHENLNSQWISSVTPTYYQRKYIRNNLIPYEDTDEKRVRGKSKYFDPKNYKNSDYFRKKLIKPIKPIIDSDDGFENVGMVKNIQDLKLRNDGYKLFGFNALASRNLDYHRTIPDTRHKLCRDKLYPINLPNASIVVCFFNEHFDTLARTLHSIVDRTPKPLLHEIILVNDQSDIPGLNEEVKSYVAKTFGELVKFYTTSQREGLIRARLFGAEMASGACLIFLDSHIEVNVDWIQPLLQRIQENETFLATPIIDIVNADTFEYSSSPLVRGGFNWGLHFKWENLPLGSLSKEEDFIKPIKSPTMAGGLFAVNRLYFNRMGKYDSGMNIWGGENLEISFRIWQCGGRIEIIPCSRVGHVFRKRRPYSAPDGEDTMTRNSLRVAHVWMDEFKDQYFQQRPEARFANYGNISSRIELRNQLDCKPFKWYLENVYPELGEQGSVLEKGQGPRPVSFTAQYHIRLSGTNLCLAPEGDAKSRGSLLILRTCLRTKAHIWWETERGELKLAQLYCLDSESALGAPNQVFLGKCHQMGANQQWKYKPGREQSPLYNVGAGTCLTAEVAAPNARVGLDICAMSPTKQWDLVSLKN